MRKLALAGEEQDVQDSSCENSLPTPYWLPRLRFCVRVFGS